MFADLNLLVETKYFEFGFDFMSFLERVESHLAVLHLPLFSDLHTKAPALKTISKTTSHHFAFTIMW
jgi:hypothetical protein